MSKYRSYYSFKNLKYEGINLHHIWQENQKLSEKRIQIWLKNEVYQYLNLEKLI